MGQFRLRGPPGKEGQEEREKVLPSDVFEFEDDRRRYSVSERCYDLVVITDDNPPPPRHYVVTRFDDGEQVRVNEDRYATRVMAQDEIRDKALQRFKERDQAK